MEEGIRWYCGGNVNTWTFEECQSGSLDLSTAGRVSNKWMKGLRRPKGSPMGLSCFLFASYPTGIYACIAGFKAVKVGQVEMYACLLKNFFKDQYQFLWAPIQCWGKSRTCRAYLAVEFITKSHISNVHVSNNQPGIPTVTRDSRGSAQQGFSQETTHMANIT